MRAFAALLLTATAAGGGCVILTGSTDGYSLVDAGSCRSTADCGDSGMVCCLDVTAAATSGAGPACQAHPCAVSVQLCKENAECGDAGTCSTQSCSVGGRTYKQSACSTLPGCTASP